MILAIDVYYYSTYAKAVGILFNWNDNALDTIIEANISPVEDYVSGEFYKRELPCVKAIIEQVDTGGLEAILIDGYVFIDNNLQLGLGGILWQYLEEKVPIIGVAKTSFFKNKNTIKEVIRGDCKNPLYISAIGYNIDTAAENIKAMHGQYRIPTLLKELDKLTKKEVTKT